MPTISDATTEPAVTWSDVAVAVAISEEELERRYKALVQSRKVAAEAQELADAIEKMKDAHALLVQEVEGLRRVALGLSS